MWFKIRSPEVSHPDLHTSNTLMKVDNSTTICSWRNISVIIITIPSNIQVYCLETITIVIMPITRSRMTFTRKLVGFFYTVHPVDSILKFLWYRTHQKSKLKLMIPMEHLPSMRIAVVLLLPNWYILMKYLRVSAKRITNVVIPVLNKFHHCIIKIVICNHIKQCNSWLRFAWKRVWLQIPVQQEYHLPACNAGLRVIIRQQRALVYSGWCG